MRKPKLLCTKHKISLKEHNDEKARFADGRKTEKEAIIYNYGSSTVNPISPQKFEALVFIRGQDMPSLFMVAPYYISYTHSIWIYWFFHLTIHLATALLADLVLLSQKKKTQWVNEKQRISFCFSSVPCSFVII